MKRAIAVAMLVLILLLSSFAAAQSEQADNLLTNGGFEKLNASGEPENWFAKFYRSQAGYSRLIATNEKAHSGQYSVLIENASSNDTRFIHTVEVEPESLYRLSGYVLVESMEDIGNGANFGIENIYAFSDCLFDTNGEWAYLEWYGETGEEQTELTIGVRVGGYSAESIGKAYFDDIVLEKVDSLPKNVIASIWYDMGSYTSSQSNESPNETSKKSTVLFILLGVLFAFAYFVVQPYLNKGATSKDYVLFGIVTLIAVILRVFLAVQVPGYEVDINCFSAWSLRIAEKGPTGFYSPDYFCDYPPGAMLLLWPTGLLLNAIGSNSAVALLIVKSLPIVCDMLGAFCLYAFVKKRMSGIAGTIMAGLYLLNPAVLVNGAAWGQVDSVLTLFMLLTVFTAMKRKWRIAIPLFVVSALVKPQALLFAPIGGMWLLFGLKNCSSDERKQEGKQLAIGALIALAAALIIIVPFSIRQENPVGWLFELYGETLSSYAYATLNTANLYYLIGANWTGLEEIVPAWLSFATIVIFAAIGADLLHQKARRFMRCKPEHARTLAWLFIASAAVQTILWIIGATYAMYGYAMMAFVYLFSILCMYADRKPAMLPYYMALALIGIYILGIKVHERYLFPALLLLLTSYVTTRDRRVIGLFVGFSVTTFINTAIVLDNAILFGAAQGHLNSDTLLVNNLLCIVNLLLCGFAFWLGLSGLRVSKAVVKDEPAKKQKIPESYRRMLFSPADARMHLTLRDYVVMTITAVLYAALAFSNLGSTVAPQTGWVSTSADEQIVLDLGEEKAFSVLYYAGVSYNHFSISVSQDGEIWTEDYPCQMREGLCWQWRYAVSSTDDGYGNVQFNSDSAKNVLWFTGRYLRVNACEAGLNLWEIVARGTDGENIPLTVVSHTGAKPELLDESKPASNLVDETVTCIGEPSWYNSMYFDEIYHAREAYHNLHGESTYEWTHPPFGKLLMAVGVAIFGMTPFGWRFAGTLIGVLMLPALYLLALQLTKKRTIAMVSMLAFALDLMHFTQTRIATIDSFPLLFILLSYLCMVRYMQTDLLALREGEKVRLFTRAFWKSLIPLFLSGLFMGLGIASKWTGAYSAVGLAVLFFLTIYRQERVGKAAFEIEMENASSAQNQKQRIRAAENFTLPRILITCGFCVIFFVLIPCLIYAISYIPQLIPDGPFTIERLIRTQENMLSYHSTPGLGMDHPFQSPWWQWPFILKPIWYVQDQFEPAGYAATIMCLGNPWVFYIGAFAMVGVFAACVLKYVRFSKGRFRLVHGDGNLNLLTIVIAFLAQYLPWMLVPRSMYIYHYFASVPFIILSTAWFLNKLPKEKPYLRYGVIGFYLLGAAVFFVMFFPYASGYVTSTSWLDAMKWFSRLYY